MGKYDVGNFISGFGEGLFSTIQSERDRKQKENEFQQRMDFENRQLALTDKWRQMQFGYDQQQDKLQAESDYVNYGSDINKISPDVQSNLFKGSQYPDIFGKDNNNYYLPRTEIPESVKTQPFDIEGSLKHNETGTYWTFDKLKGEFIDTKIPFDRNEGRSTTTNNYNPNANNTDYVNFETVDEMVRNYNKRGENDGKIAMGNSNVEPDQWRIKANEELDKVLKSSGISQEVVDKIWEVSGANENDNAVTKRKKLKNVIDQQTQLPDYQKRALYQMVEVRTR